MASSSNFIISFDHFFFCHFLHGLSWLRFVGRPVGLFGKRLAYLTRQAMISGQYDVLQGILHTTCSIWVVRQTSPQEKHGHSSDRWDDCCARTGMCGRRGRNDASPRGQSPEAIASAIASGSRPTPYQNTDLCGLGSPRYWKGRNSNNGSTAKR